MRSLLFKPECLSPLVDELLKLRQKYRANRQWAEADAIRDILYRVNITVEDDKNGSRWQLTSPSEDIQESSKKAGKS
jgi:cysteinyl-tRNA synthetase